MYSIIIQTPTRLSTQEISTFLVSQHQVIENQKNLFVPINQEDEKLSIDVIRNLQSQLQYATNPNQNIFYILHDFEQLSIEGQNCSLKMLEEPPKNTTFVLCTSSAESLLPTITSRCITLAISSSPDQASFSKEIETIWQTITSKHLYSDCIQISDKYAKRPEALQLLNSLINYGHQYMKKNPDNYATYRQVLSKLVIAQNRLQKNISVPLTLDEGLF